METGPQSTAQSPRNRQITEFLVLLFLCGFCFFYGLGNLGLVGADEPRYAQIAREMLERHDFVTPRLRGEVWLEKPVLYYWLASSSFTVFGVHDWAARIPSACFALGMVMFVYFFVRRFRPGAQMEAAVVTAITAAVLGFARGASTDMQLAAPFTAGMLCWYAWYATGKKRWLTGFYFLLAIGTLAKGPVAPGLAVCILVLFAALRREWMLLRRGVSIPGLLIYAAVALPWYIAVQLRNPEFFNFFFLQQNLERFATNRYQHAQPFWYYLPVLLLCLMPWTVIALPAIYGALRTSIAEWRSRFTGPPQEATAGDGSNRSAGLIEFLAIWAIFPIVFFSLSRSKLPGYILPAIPPCAMLAGEYLFRRRAEAVGRAMALLHSLIMGFLGGAVLLLPHLVMAPRTMPPNTALHIAAGVALAIALLLLLGIKRFGFVMVRPLTTAATVLFLWFILRAAAPTLDAALSARNVESYLESLHAQEKTVAVFRVRREVEYGLGFYRNQAIPSYDRKEIPGAAHILVTYKVSEPELRTVLEGRQAAKLGEYAPQKLEIYRVAAP